MAAAPIGAVVKIDYDAALGVSIEDGDALVTSTGRTYVILRAKRMAVGRKPNHWRLRCQVAEGPPPPGVPVHTLKWYRR